MKNDDLKPVADQNGQPISGLYKSPKTGVMVVEKNQEYDRYVREKENLKKVNSLSKQVEQLSSEMSELKDLLRQSIKNNGTKE